MGEIVLVVAAADNGVIGKDGAIPWHISADLKRFKALTLGHPIVMGRKTWDSLPKKPLPGRINIVITRQPGWSAEGATTASSLDEALALADGPIFVIGGAQIYAAALAQAHRIELTQVHGLFEGDAHLPPLPGGWREIARENHQTEAGLGYSFVTLIRE